MKPMTEAEWLAGADPEPMLRRAPGPLTDRKCRLFACACCRRVWDLLPELDSRAAVDAAERFADGLIESADLRAAWERALAVSRAFSAAGVAAGGAATERGRVARVRESAASAAGYASHPLSNAPENRYSGARGAAESAAFAAALNASADEWIGQRAAERASSAALLRCVVGNPFRPAAFDPAWRTDTAVAVARQMYDAREFSALPILADALQDAGCDSDEVLSHCRDASLTHARGCWVIDLVLGKE